VGARCGMEEGESVMVDEKAPRQSCGKCLWLTVALDKLGRRIPRAQMAYRCRFPVVMQPLPDSVTRAHDYRPPAPSMWMQPSYGTSCPTFEPLTRPEAQ
jgi:hypothetical protein